MENKKAFYLWIFFNCSLFFLFSSLLNRTMFDAEIDGFLSQMLYVSNSSDLDILSLMYQFRYYLVYPFHYFHFGGAPNFFQHFFLFIYISPIFTVKVPGRVKYFSVLLLYLSFFFSYRSVLVMTSTYLIFCHIYYHKIAVKYLVISFMYSLLSTGTFLILIVLVLLFKKSFFRNKKLLKNFKYYIIFFLLIISGPLIHKSLFFIDPVAFGSAANISVDAILSIDFGDLGILYDTMTERSMVNEAIETENYGRLYIISCVVLMIFILFIFTSNKIVRTLFFLIILSLLFEGLMTYSLLFTIVVLFYDFLIKTIRGKRYEAPYFN